MNYVQKNALFTFTQYNNNYDSPNFVSQLLVAALFKLVVNINSNKTLSAAPCW